MIMFITIIIYIYIYIYIYMLVAGTRHTPTDSLRGITLYYIKHTIFRMLS